MTKDAILLASVDCCLWLFNISVKCFGRYMISSGEKLEQTQVLFEFTNVFKWRLLNIVSDVLLTHNKGISSVLFCIFETICKTGMKKAPYSRNCKESSIYFLNLPSFFCLFFVSLLLPLYVQALIRSRLVIPCGN